jgi:hypothetical protein
MLSIMGVLIFPFRSCNKPVFLYDFNEKTGL